MAPRFLTLADVTEILNISAQQAYSLVRTGDLPAIQVGGRGIWRVEASELEAYIARQYEATRKRLDEERGDMDAHEPSAADRAADR
jgi:excisionase family DNA binding protein